MTENIIYPGNELELFKEATRWKQYFSDVIKPYVKGRVLEVGAGLGATTPYLQNDAVSLWTVLEPDPAMSAALIGQKEKGLIDNRTEIAQGTLNQLENRVFDTILYIDVLEHIEKDFEEVQKVTLLLARGGRLIVLAPAHPALYSPFDKTIGHFRRYTGASLRQLVEPLLQTEKILYLDSLGFLLSFANRWWLKQSSPKPKQIAFWDKKLLPFSRIIDRLTFHWIGRSVVGIWVKK